MLTLSKVLNGISNALQASLNYAPCNGNTIIVLETIEAIFN